MIRSSPPPAISAPMAILTGSTTTSRSSDLPLRAYQCPSETTAEPSPGSPRPVLSQATFGPAVPDTPNSIAAEYGDDCKEAAPSAAALTERVFQSYARHRSRSAVPSQNNAKTNPPPVTRSPSETRARSIQRRDLSPTTKPLDEKEKVQRFLRSMTPPSPIQELIKENRSLQQRIAALQRTEQGLLNDNQDLARRLASAQKRHDTRRQKWKEELLNREKVFEARIRDLESRLALQEEDIFRLALDQSRETSLDDKTITSWFANKADIWRRWTHYAAHRDPNRVQSGLHPLQVRELCDGVKHFVQLTDNGELPDTLMAPAGFQTAQVLLDGLLANFMFSSTMESPFWVFDVLRVNSLEMESPGHPRADSGSPVGFRMDLALQNLTLAPSRDETDVRSPQPLPLTNGAQWERDKLRRLVTSMQPTTIFADPATTGVSDQTLPSRKSMEDLYQVLLSLPGGHRNAHAWRSSVMKSFNEGGMSAEADSELLTEDARILAEARLRYAARLKDTFLRGPARFLLRDQDAVGIEKIEDKLVQEIDAALRFSCQLWCRRDPPVFQDLRDLSNATFRSSRDDMELCYAQTPRYTLPTERVLFSRLPPPDFHDGQSVIMVVRPCVRSSTSNLGHDKAANDIATKFWTKASVMVTAPKLVQEPASEADPESPGGASIKAMVGTPVSAATPSLPFDDRNKPAILTLPSFVYNDAPQSMIPKPLSLPHDEPAKSRGTT
ncbi:hypothetical protein VTI74DRAFT_5736 [Chaetomium olivicolor]